MSYSTAGAAVAALVLIAGPLHAQKVKPAPLSLEASQSSNEFLPQFGVTTTAPAPAVSGFQLAPMPNSNLSAPVAPTSNTAQVSPSLFQPKKQFRGDGFSYGSTAQSWQEQKLKPAPGVSLKVPLE